MVKSTIKDKGSSHYKTGGVEPMDLYKAGGFLAPFAACSIIKYAFRMLNGGDWKKSDIEKIIHYAEMIKEEKCQEEETDSEGHLEYPPPTKEELEILGLLRSNPVPLTSESSPEEEKASTPQNLPPNKCLRYANGISPVCVRIKTWAENMGLFSQRSEIL